MQCLQCGKSNYQETASLSKALCLNGWLGAEQVSVATTYNNLGQIHRDLGDFEQAKECHQRALSITLKKLGAEHVDVATIYGNLGLVHRDLGDFQQAKEYHQLALTIDLKTIGAEHVFTPTNMFLYL